MDRAVEATQIPCQVNGVSMDLIGATVEGPIVENLQSLADNCLKAGLELLDRPNDKAISVALPT